MCRCAERRTAIVEVLASARAGEAGAARVVDVARFVAGSMVEDAAGAAATMARLAQARMNLLRR